MKKTGIRAFPSQYHLMQNRQTEGDVHYSVARYLLRILLPTGKKCNQPASLHRNYGTVGRSSFTLSILVGSDSYQRYAVTIAGGEDFDFALLLPYSCLPFPKHTKISRILPQKANATFADVHSWDAVGACGASSGATAFTATCTCDKIILPSHNQHSLSLSYSGPDALAATRASLSCSLFVNIRSDDVHNR